MYVYTIELCNDDEEEDSGIWIASKYPIINLRVASGKIRLREIDQNIVIDNGAIDLLVWG